MQKEGGKTYEISVIDIVHQSLILWAQLLCICVCVSPNLKRPRRSRGMHMHLLYSLAAQPADNDGNKSKSYFIKNAAYHERLLGATDGAEIISAPSIAEMSI
jgi:hypothetical protein